MCGAKNGINVRCQERDFLLNCGFYFADRLVIERFGIVRGGQCSCLGR